MSKARLVITALFVENQNPLRSLLVKAAAGSGGRRSGGRNPTQAAVSIT
jgi:hypothetical protein